MSPWVRAGNVCLNSHGMTPAKQYNDTELDLYPFLKSGDSTHRANSHLKNRESETRTLCKVFRPSCFIQGYSIYQGLLRDGGETNQVVSF